MEFDPMHAADEQAQAGSSATDTALADSETPHKFVSFFLGDKHYAIPAHAVLEVVGYLSPTRLPDAPAAMLGIAPLRGDILAVVDPGVSSVATQSEKRKAVVLRPIDQTTEMPIAFNVDRIGELLQVNPADIRIASENDPLAAFESNSNGRSVLIVDPSQVQNLIAEPEK